MDEHDLPDPHKERQADEARTAAAVDAVAETRRKVSAASKALEEAAASYRAAVVAYRDAKPQQSERAAAKALGLSQTALRDLLRKERRRSR